MHSYQMMVAYVGPVPHSKKSTGTKTRTRNIVNGGYIMAIKYLNEKVGCADIE